MSGLCFRLLYCATLDFLFYSLCDIGHFFERWPSTHLFVFQIVNLRICLLAFAYTLILSHQPRNVNTFMLKNAPFQRHFCSSLMKRQLVLLSDVFSRRIEPFIRDCRRKWAEAKDISARAGESVYCHGQHFGHFDLSPLLCSVFVRLDLIPFGHHGALDWDARFLCELRDDLIAPFLV